MVDQQDVAGRLSACLASFCGLAALAMMALVYVAAPPLYLTIMTARMLQHVVRVDPALIYDPSFTPPELGLHSNPDGMARIAAAIEQTVAAPLRDRRHGA